MNWEKTIRLSPFVAATVLLSVLAIQAWRLPEIAGKAAARRADALLAEMGASRKAVLDQVAAARVDVLTRSERQVAALRTDVLAEVAQIRKAADARIGDSLVRVDTAIGEVQGLRADVKPILANVEAVTAHANEASSLLLRRDALPAQILGLTGAAKVTLGETATTMRAIQRATPEMLATVQQVGENIKATTQASTQASHSTAEVMANFARATRPLPAWARITLTAAPSVAQVGSSVTTTLALTGKIGAK